MSVRFCIARASVVCASVVRASVVRASLTVLVAVAAAMLSTPLAAQGTPPAVKAPGAPEIFFRAPVDGDTVGTTFAAVFGLRNYGVAPAGVQLSNTGHFHVLVDVESPAPGALIPADAHHIHFGGGQIESRLTLAPGRHTLRLVLADHEHRMISDALVSAQIRITVRAR